MSDDEASAISQRLTAIECAIEALDSKLDILLEFKADVDKAVAEFMAKGPLSIMSSMGGLLRKNG